MPDEREWTLYRDEIKRADNGKIEGLTAVFDLNDGLEVGDRIVVVPKSSREAAEAEVERLRKALRESADQHHRTLTGSRLHDPEHIEDFEDCPAKSCQHAAAALSLGGGAPKSWKQIKHDRRAREDA